MDILYSNTNFYDAVKRGNIQKVESMYNAAQGKPFGKININWQNSRDDYNTPLLIAIQNKNYELIEFLLNKGAEVNPGRVTEDKLSPLLYLINKTPRDDLTLQIVTLLLEKGARPNLGYIPSYNDGYGRQRPQAITPVTIVRNWPDDGIEGDIKHLILQTKLKKISGAVQSMDSLVSEGQNPLTNDLENLENLNDFMGKGGRRKRRRKTNKKRKTSRRRKSNKKRRR
jgi:ankyrin repeat protein